VKNICKCSFVEEVILKRQSFLCLLSHTFSDVWILLSVFLLNSLLIQNIKLYIEFTGRNIMDYSHLKLHSVDYADKLMKLRCNQTFKWNMKNILTKFLPLFCLIDTWENFQLYLVTFLAFQIVYFRMFEVLNGEI
jgi:hypothetical protein